MNEFRMELMGDPAALALVGSVFWGMVIVGIAMLVLNIIAYWRLFTKAGEAGWKSLIPVYSSYKMFQISWKTSMFWAYLVAMIVYIILFGISAAFPGGAGVVLFVLAMLSWLVALIISIAFCFKMAKAYGHGVGFGFGLLFLHFIFLLILAFGKSEYQGAQE